VLIWIATAGLMFILFILHRSVAETGQETERETCEGEEDSKEEESRKAEEGEK